MKIVKSISLFILIFFRISGNLSAQQSNDELKVKYVDLIHCTHTDYGFTDNPYIARHLHELYIDVAIDAALSTIHKKQGEQFCWTAEAMDPVCMWWTKASPERRKDLIKVIQSGQLDITGLPFNIEPFLNKTQWQQMLHWVPDSLWDTFHPTAAMQDDVNGCPRAAAIALLDRNIKHLWMGINVYWGGTPFKVPYAFWWKMPDGRKIFVWQSFPYYQGYDFFAKETWRMGDFQPRASDVSFWSPRPGDILASDEKSVREANKICIEKIKALEKDGYPYDFLSFSFTNQWRMDNDCPFPALVDFAATWNRLGLKPELRLTTVAKSMKNIEEKLGSTAPAYEGEWLDWWSFGEGCWPREMAASRHAKRVVESILSPVWGPMGERGQTELNQIIKDLCRWDEHTDGSNETMTNPYSHFTVGQIDEAAILAYRSNERAQWLLSQQAHTKLSNEPEGFYVVNTSNTPYSGWVKFHAYTFRKVNYKSLTDAKTKQSFPIIYNDKEARFWAENIPANSVVRYLPDMNENTIKPQKQNNSVVVKTDETNWPVSLTWNNMKPFDVSGIGNFLSVNLKENTDALSSNTAIDLQKSRWKMQFEIRNVADEKLHAERRKTMLDENWSKLQEKATVTETPYTITYSQPFYHPRLKWGTRSIEIWKNSPHASVNIKYYRISGEFPEIYFAYFPFPQTESLPLLSNGGIPYTAYKDELPNCLMDYFIFDAWVKYTYPDGNWIWSTKELPIVTFGGHQVMARLSKAPENTNQLYAMLYNNLWEVNFLIDQPGVEEFNFDMVWRDKKSENENTDEFVKTIQSEPVVFMNPQTREDKIILDRLYKP